MSDLAEFVRTSSSRSSFLLFMLVLGIDTVVRASFAQKHSEWSLYATPNIPASEMNALYDIYNATNGEDWQWSDDIAADGIPWNFTDPILNNPCVDHWQGVNCNFTSPFDFYYVTDIFLSSYNLVGTLPDTFDALSKLQLLDLNTNQLTGSIPMSFGNLTQLRELNLGNNILSNTIPETLGNVTQLEYLGLYQNQIFGTLPESLGNLKQLRHLELDVNGLVGPIPESFGNLQQLRNFTVSFNFLTSTIPASLGNPAELQYLDLNTNFLVGAIPESLGNLTQLQFLYLNHNQLTKCIPQSLGNLTQLLVLNLAFNEIAGSIPESFSYLLQLEELVLSFNRLTGTIPESLGGLPDLIELLLNTNQLNGTIPASLGNLMQLQHFNLNTNRLTGTVPDSLGNLAQLSYLFVAQNQLIGTIPESLGRLSQLRYLFMFKNYLTGPIPESLGSLTQMLYLYLYDNQLTSTIPESLHSLRQLIDLEMNINKLTGTVPESLGNLTQLQFLKLDNNRLSGTIPTMLSRDLLQLHLSNNQLQGNIPSLVKQVFLQVVLLHSNHLTGSLDHVFDPTVQLQVKTIVVANNQLTGTLPVALFQLNLQTFVGTSNCFEGPLPIAAICDNRNMISFVIDGMSSASSCHNKLFLGSSAYSLEHAIGGTIPICLLQLPYLTTLHLSGNGFTGSIPNNIVLSNTLTDLTLSHNLLTGSIPQQLQLRNWDTIDLSYNRLSGTLLSDFAANGSIDLENNRISGTIPAPFHSKQNLSILGSNTFACDYNQKDLPEHDPNRNKYHCGSNSFDILFYIWLGILVCAAVAVGYYEVKYRTIQSILDRDSRLQGTNVYATLSVVGRLTLRSALYSIVVLLPLYAACSVSYGTQTYAYAYQVSAVYISGVVPFALNWCFWWILLIVVILTVLGVSPSTRDTTELQENKQPESPSSSPWQTLSTIVPYVLIDITVVAGVNAAYVYVAVYQSSSLLVLFQTLLSIFKVVWGRLALPYILAALSRRGKVGRIHLFTQIIVYLLNNIVIPCLIVAVVSPSCFYNALIAAPSVSATVGYVDCKLADATTGECFQYSDVPLSTTYDPPFTYNYQCSSSLITYYSPAFVSMCIVNTLVPAMALYMRHFVNKHASSRTVWFRLIERCYRAIAGPPSSTTNNPDKRYLNIDGLMTALISTLGLILTFGVMFPPLCVAFTVSICATVFYFRNNVGRIIQDHTQQKNDDIVEVIRAECNSVDAMLILKGSVWLLITVSCWFYTLFLFDTLGNAVGFDRAYWVLIVMPLMPLVLYVLYLAVLKYFSAPARSLISERSHDQRHEGDDESEVEVETRRISIIGADVHNVLILDAADAVEDVNGQDML